RYQRHRDFRSATPSGTHWSACQPLDPSTFGKRASLSLLRTSRRQHGWSHRFPDGRVAEAAPGVTEPSRRLGHRYCFGLLEAVSASRLIRPRLLVRNDCISVGVRTTETPGSPTRATALTALDHTLGTDDQ